MTSCCLFVLRDAVTIFASFNLPPLLAPRLSLVFAEETSQLRAAQFFLPAAIQFVTTPVHLLGLDLHNRRGKIGYRSRFDRVGRDMSTAVPARIMRILPAFGLGGIVNTGIRNAWR